MIPSVEKCFEYMHQYGMLDNIKEHSIMVERVAVVITKGLKAAGVTLSTKKVRVGALMHDIGKTMCLNTTEDHAGKGVEICLKHHLHDITDIVGEHIRLKNFDPLEAISEKEIVYYADKRVNHDKVVSIEKRLEYLLERYGKGREGLDNLIKENFELCKAVEKKLFAKLSFGPDDLAELI